MEIAVVQAPNPEPRYLERAATQIKEWADPSEAERRELAKRNEVPLVMLLTGSGPQYVLKTHLAGSDRVTEEIYVDSTFKNLLLSLELSRQGIAERVFNDMRSFFVAAGHPCAGLLPRRRNTREHLVQHVLFHDDTNALATRLVDEATTHGEWEIISHDSTFKALFSIIGQVPMAQAEGGLHALHTVTGKTGAVLGSSPQPSERDAHTIAALQDILPGNARATVRWMFSDMPSSLQRCTHVFQILVGVAEDPLHLTFRIDRCYSGTKRSAVARRVLDLHRKFRAPIAGVVYTGGPPAPGAAGTWNGARTPQFHATAEAWEAYCSRPFRSHQEYIDQLLLIARMYLDEMERPCGSRADENTLKDILIAGSRYQHFAYLNNGCRVLHAMPEAVRRHLAWGTTANEALHMQIKGWHANVRVQHAERVPHTMRAFSLAKMTTHNAAAYHPTTAQRTQSELLSTICGGLRVEFIKPTQGVAQPVAPHRLSLKRPLVVVDAGVKERRAEARTRQAAAVERQKAIDASVALRKRPAAFKPEVKVVKRPAGAQRAGSKKRTVFTRLRKKTAVRE